MKIHQSRRPFAILSLCALGLLSSQSALADPAGGPSEPVRYIGHAQADATHAGGLPIAVGVKSWQAFRANRAYPERAAGF